MGSLVYLVLYRCPGHYAMVFEISSVCLNGSFSFRLELEKYCKEMVQPFTDIVSNHITTCVCIVLVCAACLCTHGTYLCFVYCAYLAYSPEGASVSFAVKKAKPQVIYPLHSCFLQMSKGHIMEDFSGSRASHQLSQWYHINVCVF